MEIPKDLKDEIWEYCKVNDIPNIVEFNIKLIRQGFTAEKYGSTPFKTKEIVKEVEVEVIKEVMVEKEVYVTDDEANTKLTDQIKEIQLKFDNQGIDIYNITKERNELKTNVDLLKKELQVLKDKNKDIYGE
jgi:hypothetical protein